MMKIILLAMIKFYSTFISPLMKPRCKYYPTCSAYSYEAIETHGIFLGLFYSVYRIIRCNPFSNGGYDPVPLKKPYSCRPHD